MNRQSNGVKKVLLRWSVIASVSLLMAIWHLPSWAQFSNGTLDLGFNPDIDGTVRAIVEQTDGKILVGGSFQINGIVRNIARLNADGSLDSSFAATTDISSAGSGVLAIVQLVDGRIVIGGGFSLVNGVARRRIALLNQDGRDRKSTV